MDVVLVKEEARRLPTDGAGARAGVAFVRILFGLLWLTQASWKSPPDFGALKHFTSFAYREPVFPPYGFVVEKVVIPNITIFGYLVIVTEASLGAFLILGLATRFWALVGIAQTIAISLSVLNAPNEWSWAYYMMFAGHVTILATAAGRSFGLDGLLRPGWLRTDHVATRLLARAS